jgi:hypothetical protein
MDYEKQRVRDVHRSRSNPMICQTAKHLRPVSRLTRQSLRLSFISIRSLVLAMCLLTTYALSVASNIHAYSRMPIRRALPDVISDTWSDFALWRTTGFHHNFPIPRLVTAILLLFALYYTYYCFNVCNIRKYVVLLSLALLFRCLVLIATQIPPPCHGFPNCSCSQVTFPVLIKKFSIVTIAAVYFGTFGYGTAAVPCCGDVMMSGQAIVQVVLALYLIDTMKLLLSESKLGAATFTLIVLIAIASPYSILIRAEYTISVVLSVVFVLMEEWVYQIGQTMCQFAYGPFVTTRFGRLFLWLEREFEEADDDGEAE